MAESMTIQPLTREAFAPFGDVVEFEGREFFPINNGMADRYHALADVELGGEQARATISLVASRQFDMPRRVDHLEYHPLGSQAFLPLDLSPFVARLRYQRQAGHQLPPRYLAPRAANPLRADALHLRRPRRYRRQLYRLPFPHCRSADTPTPIALIHKSWARWYKSR